MIGVSKFYNKRPILKDIYLSFFYGAKIGVVGLNGAGKSSLLRILAGVDKDFNGQTTISPGYSVGLLEQEPRIDDGLTVKEAVEQGARETVDLLNEFDIINRRFAEPMSDEDMDKLLNRQAEVQEKLDSMNAWDLDSKLEMAMDALRCPPGDTPVKVLSGGRKGGSLFAGSFSRIPTFCCSMSPQITLMPKLSAGSNTTFSATPARS